MNEVVRKQLSELIKRQMVASADPKVARASLLRSGLYRDDGTLKPAYGGKGKN